MTFEPWRLRSPFSASPIHAFFVGEVNLRPPSRSNQRCVGLIKNFIPGSLTSPHAPRRMSQVQPSPTKEPAADSGDMKAFRILAKVGHFLQKGSGAPNLSLP